MIIDIRGISIWNYFSFVLQDYIDNEFIDSDKGVMHETFIS